jgi:hypothetical protein
MFMQQFCGINVIGELSLHLRANDLRF